jgi:hypothetical protein
MANKRAIDARARRASGRRLLLYWQLAVLCGITVAVLALVMYGADRHVLRGQLTGGWSSEGTTVTFYEEGTYRWHSGDTAGPPVIHRGFFRIAGRDQISLTDVGVTAAEPFTPATATYTAHVVADQLTLRNAQQTLIFIRAAQ